jgi:flagellar hook protein FlgE
MYSGLSGLISQQTKLNVIGNNIANINTLGYKSQRATFSDVFSQTLRSTTGPSRTSGRGGINPMQVGYGSKVSSIDTNMSTGSTQTTGNNRDALINGAGFFIIKDGNSGQYNFSRAGNFSVDTEGNLTVNGMKVCGWQQYTTDTDGKVTYNTQTAIQPINLYDGKTIMPPKGSTMGQLAGNLDPSKKARGSALDNISNVPGTPDGVTTMSVYDDQGNSYDIQVKFSKCYTDASTSGSATGSMVLDKNGYTVTAGTNDKLKLAVDGGAQIEITIPASKYESPTAFVNAVNTTVNSAPEMAGKVTAKLTSDGKISFISTYTGDNSGVAVNDGTSPGALAAYIGTVTTAPGATRSGNTSWFWQAVSSSSDATVGSPANGYLEFDSKGKSITTDAKFNPMPSLTLRTRSGTINLKMDMSQIATYKNSDDTKVNAGTDGYAAGKLSDFAIGNDGVIVGVYSNNQRQPLGMLALAKFTNSAGLEKIGDNLYKTTTNSGTFTGGVAPGSEGTGGLLGGALEGSNVDLAEQFSEMMIASRSYQANSKVITTEDSLMETAINLMRR